MPDESGEQKKGLGRFLRKRSKGELDPADQESAHSAASSEPPASQASDSPSAEGETKKPRKAKPSLVLADNQELVLAEKEESTPLVNPDWRDARKQYTGKFKKKWGILSASPQELQLWLQEGGWRFVAGGAFLIVLVLVGILTFTRNGGEQAIQRDPETGNPIIVPPGQLTSIPLQTTVPGQPNADAPTQPVGTQPGTQPEPPPAAPAPNDNTSIQPAFIVVNTGGNGLRLRATPDGTSAVLTTVPEGERVQQIGEDVTGAGYVWRNVRAPDGTEGWVAIDWLQPVP
jgi:hypothetical protein